jgi:hypothetical protein
MTVIKYTFGDSFIDYYPYLYSCELWAFLDDEQYVNSDIKIRQYMRDQFKSIEFNVDYGNLFRFNDIADETFYLLWAADRTVEIEI